MIPYIGSKFGLSEFILPKTPINSKNWIEPFGGSFGLFFAMDIDKYPSTEFIYNDINPLNCDLFNSLKYPKFINKIKSTFIDKEIFMKSYIDVNSSSRIDRSLAWLIILSCSNIKDLMSKEFMGTFKFDMIKQKIEKYNKYFNRIKIHNMDYKKVIKKYDSEDSFFYIDPPYFGYENYYYNNTFTSHKELNEVVKSIKGKWALSYYSFPEMMSYYSEFKIQSKKLPNSEEFLITNY